MIRISLYIAKKRLCASFCFYEKTNCSLAGSEENAKEELLERSSSLDSLQELLKRIIYQ